MLRQVIEVHDLLDGPDVSGEKVASFFSSAGTIAVNETVTDGDANVDVVRLTFPGSRGKVTGGDAPTLGIIGRLGGLAMRPARLGLVSDADGALVALASAAKLQAMARQGDCFDGDVIVSASICGQALLEEKDGIERVSAPLSPSIVVPAEVDDAMEAIISVDTTRGNRIVNTLGIAITPTVKQGYILPVSEDLIGLLEVATGRPALVLPLSDQDITPYGHGLYHINSIMQPSLYTAAPVIGLALTSATLVPGTATGATQLTSVEVAARFCLEAASRYGRRHLNFYSADEWETLVRLYGARDYSVQVPVGRQ